MNDVPSTLNDTQSMQMKNNYIHPHSKIKKIMIYMMIQLKYKHTYKIIIHQ